MPIDRFGNLADTVSSPATRSTPITPHDTAVIDPVPKGVLIGTGGVIVGQLRDDTADRSFTLAAGYHPLRFKLIKAADTTASGIVGLD